MTNGTRTIMEHLDALTEANVQFHWGAVVEEVELAASRLRAMDLNPMLASGLEIRANRMRIIETLLVPIREVWTRDQRVNLRRRSIKRIIARRTKATALRA